MVHTRTGLGPARAGPGRAGCSGWPRPQLLWWLSCWLPRGRPHNPPPDPHGHGKAACANQQQQHGVDPSSTTPQQLLLRQGSPLPSSLCTPHTMYPPHYVHPTPSLHAMALPACTTPVPAPVRRPPPPLRDHPSPASCWPRQGNFVAMSKHAKWKYLISADGHTASCRLGHIMQVGRAQCRLALHACLHACTRALR